LGKKQQKQQNPAKDHAPKSLELTREICCCPALSKTKWVKPRESKNEIDANTKVNGRKPNDKELLVICNKKNVSFEEGKWLLEE
jgi:hypothetical protein